MHRIKMCSPHSGKEASKTFNLHKRARNVYFIMPVLIIFLQKRKYDTRNIENDEHKEVCVRVIY
jgi:hypothetical protein